MKSNYKDRFPRSSKYDLNWLTNGAFGANPLWLMEWLSEIEDFKPGQHILDLGCGRAKSSIFLAKEFDVNVWAVDYWVDAQENGRRIKDFGLDKQITPIRSDIRHLEFESEFFDKIVGIDSFQYFATDDLFLPYIIKYLKPEGTISFASAGTIKEVKHPVPKHLEKFWGSDCWSLHTAKWWKQHWERTGLVDVTHAEPMKEGWQTWLQWATDCDFDDWYKEIIEQDHGNYLGYIRVTGNLTENGLSYDVRDSME